jgi:serine phosphatase RsbU (regulator of sigma subunit)
MTTTERSPADPASVAALLRQTPSFTPLSDAQREHIVRQGAVLRLKPGAVFIRQGEMADTAFLVLDGTVNVDVATDAGHVTVAVLGRGTLVGEIAAFAMTERTASVIAASEVTLLRIDQRTIRDVLAQSPDSAVAIVGELGHRLQSLNGTMATLTQAAKALAAGSFEPGMLDVLRQTGDRFVHFAEVFGEMAREIQNKRLLAQEMATAAEIQRALLPRPMAGDARFDIAAVMTPAKEVGGDFYDHFLLDPDMLAVAVGDVSGKGVPAAIFMSVSRTVLRTVARLRLTPAETLARVNDQLADGNSEAMFVTLAFGTLDLRTGAFTWASGGHEEVYFLSPGAPPAKGGPTGPALGFFEGAAYREEMRRLAPGDAVVLATDGVTEAFDPRCEQFGEARTLAALSRAEGAHAAAIVAQIEAEVARHVRGEPASDDLTCLVLRFLGP